jgi:H+/gluconate symporter-like permease
VPDRCSHGFSAGSTAVEIAATQTAAALPLLRFITHPDIVMLLTLAVAAVTLGTTRGKPLAAVMATYGTALAGDLWLFKEYFNSSIPDTFRCWTAMETIVSLVGLMGVLVLARIV